MEGPAGSKEGTRRGQTSATGVAAVTVDPATEHCVVSVHAMG